MLWIVELLGMLVQAVAEFAVDYVGEGVVGRSTDAASDRIGGDEGGETDATGDGGDAVDFEPPTVDESIVEEESDRRRRR